MRGKKEQERKEAEKEVERNIDLISAPKTRRKAAEKIEVVVEDQEMED
jgi:hypothetical protein